MHHADCNLPLPPCTATRSVHTGMGSLYPPASGTRLFTDIIFTFMLYKIHQSDTVSAPLAIKQSLQANRRLHPVSQTHTLTRTVPLLSRCWGTRLVRWHIPPSLHSAEANADMPIHQRQKHCSCRSAEAKFTLVSPHGAWASAHPWLHCTPGAELHRSAPPQLCPTRPSEFLLVPEN